MSYEPREFLRHILFEAEYLVGVSAGLTRRQLEDDPTLQRAVVRSLEIIGEASKRVPPVDFDIVWDVLQTKIPQLHVEMRRILGAS